MQQQQHASVGPFLFETFPTSAGPEGCSHLLGRMQSGMEGSQVVQDEQPVMLPTTSTSRPPPPDSDDRIVRASSTFKPAAYEGRVQAEASASARELEKEWSIDLHEGVPSLTVKALIAGVLVGGFCSFLALYYSLKTGVIPSLNILSGLGGFLIVRLFLRLGIFRGIFTPQENAVVQTIAVACYAVSSTGIGFGAGYLAMSYNAFVDLGGEAFEGNRESDTFALTWPRNLLWCLSLSFFGFFIAFPVRDYVILKQKLSFPSGTVTAYVIKNMFKKASQTVKSLALMAKFFALAFCTGLFTWAWEGLDGFPLFGEYARRMYTWGLDWDVGSFGIGMILSPQINGSMLLGALLGYGLLQPALVNHANGPGKWFDLDNLPGKSDTSHGVEYLGYKCYTVFAGLGVMIVNGLFTLIVLMWTLYRDYRADRAQRANNGEPQHGEDDGPNGDLTSPGRMQTVILTEKFRNSRVPVWVPYAGYLVMSAVTIILLHFEFRVHWYQTLVAIAIIPLFAFSNIQGVGRTDWDVSSAYGKMVMFPFGAWNAEESILPSLALCCVTISGCSNAGSLLQDFKTGYLVGASPNSMFLAQLYGAFIGCFITPTLWLLLSSTFVIPSSDPDAFLPGRYGTIYRTLAVIASGQGFGALPTHVATITLGFMGLALICLLLQTFLPPKYGQYIPDTSGMSIGLLVPASVSVQFCIGGSITWWWCRCSSTAASKVPYIASGCVAGSGISTVVRCILSLISINAPVRISYKDSTQVLHPGQWVGAMFFILLFVAVFACGAWFWNRCDDDEEANMHQYDLEKVEEQPTEIEQSSFKKADDSVVAHQRKA